MIVHGSTLSPFVRKVMAYAGERGIEIENRPTGGPGPKPAELMKISPFGKIPAFEDGDYALSDSSAIIHYLEAKLGGAGLIPSEARARGRAIWFDELADTIVFAAVVPIFFNRVVARLVGMESDAAAADKAEAEALPPVLDYLESVIPESGFLVEDRMTIADIAVASPFANMEHCGVTIDAVRYPKTVAWQSAILARPAFSALIEKERRFLGK